MGQCMWIPETTLAQVVASIIRFGPRSTEIRIAFFPSHTRRLSVLRELRHASFQSLCSVATSMLLAHLAITLVRSICTAFAQTTSVTVGLGPDSRDCTEASPLHKCIQERVLLWGVMLLAALMGTTCLAALNTPTKFPQPKERTE